MKQHIKAIDWALAQGYNMSVTDLQADDGEWDALHSTDRAEIIAATEATDIPNVYIYWPERERPSIGHGIMVKHRHILTFSVIDEGNPDETINDYTVPRDDADQWRIDAGKAFEAAIYAEPATESQIALQMILEDFEIIQSGRSEDWDGEDWEGIINNVLRLAQLLGVELTQTEQE